jgi:hypothetical protein
MGSGKSAHQAADPADAVNSQCQRFWMPRGNDPPLSDRGFLAAPIARGLQFPVGALPFEDLAEVPVLGLLGEPGIGKTTTVNQEAARVETVVGTAGDIVLQVDLV